MSNKKYVVKLHQDRRVSCEIEVFADSQEEAERMALELAEPLQMSTCYVMDREPVRLAVEFNEDWEVEDCEEI